MWSKLADPAPNPRPWKNRPTGGADVVLWADQPRLDASYFEQCDDGRLRPVVPVRFGQRGKAHPMMGPSLPSCVTGLVLDT